MSIKSFTIFIVSLLCVFNIHAQTTRIRGVVTDADTGAPIQWVNVSFPGTIIGALTDEKGLFVIESRDTSSMLDISSVGYISQTKRVKLNAFNQIDVALKLDNVKIKEVTVVPGPNPAHPILREVIARREKNDPKMQRSFKCEAYTKIQLDLSNIKGEFRSKRLQKKLGFIFDYVDTSALTGKPYLPAMISESIADLYNSKEPEVNREIVKANRVSGIRDSGPIAQFTGKMTGDVDFYKGFIEVFNIRFAGPLSKSGLSFYNYFLVDSMQVDGRKTYKIRFHPKRLATQVLDGELLIDSASYAIRSAAAHMPKGSNVNWIKHLSMECSNRLIDSAHWFMERDRLSAEFAIVNSDSSKLNTFIGTRERAYKNSQINIELPPEATSSNVNVTMYGDDITKSDESYWQKARPYELTNREKRIYEMVDSIQTTPIYRNIYTIINTIIGGYYNTKYVGIGPYFKLISFNNLEGFRAQIGARTTQAVSRKVRVMGYVAYSTKDDKFKGGGDIELMFNRRITRKLTLSGRHDVLQLGAGTSLLAGNNILSSIFTRGGSRMSMVDQASATYEHEWINGISTYLNSGFRRIHSNRYVEMTTPAGNHIPYIDDYSVGVSLRVSKDERVFRNFFEKKYLHTPYPIFSFTSTFGKVHFDKTTSSYCRLEAALKYKPNIPPIGYSEIMLQGGKIFGKVPYPILKLHEGNGTYFYDRYAFSCMNFYEFASDAWVALFYEHHFNGWILGRIPLLKKLKWREVVTCKCVWGTLEARNNGSLDSSTAYFAFPEGMSSVNKPYVEVGIGIENIFRIFRVDCVWRVTHRLPNNGKAMQNFAINASVQLKF